MPSSGKDSRVWATFTALLLIFILPSAIFKHLLFTLYQTLQHIYRSTFCHPSEVQEKFIILYSQPVQGHIPPLQLQKEFTDFFRKSKSY